MLCIAAGEKSSCLRALLEVLMREPDRVFYPHGIMRTRLGTRPMNTTASWSRFSSGACGKKLWTFR